MKLTDILPIEKWIALEKDLHNRYGLDVNVFDTSGVRISDFKEWVNSSWVVPPAELVAGQPNYLRSGIKPLRIPATF